MSTRACYRFISSEGPDSWAGVVTVYKHSDGYPDGAAKWIEAALEHAWQLPRYENDEFAAAFVAANKSLTTYYEREARLKQAELAKLMLNAPDGGPSIMEQVKSLEKQIAQCLEQAKEYRTGRYRDFTGGGGVRLVPFEGMNAHARFASDTGYLYDITVKQAKGTPGKPGKAKLVVTAYTTIERDGKWWVKKFFEGSTKGLAKAKAPEYDSRNLGEPDFTLDPTPEVSEPRDFRVVIYGYDAEGGTWLGPMESREEAEARWLRERKARPAATVAFERVYRGVTAP